MDVYIWIKTFPFDILLKEGNSAKLLTNKGQGNKSLEVYRQITSMG